MHVGRQPRSQPTVCVYALSILALSVWLGGAAIGQSAEPLLVDTQWSLITDQSAPNDKNAAALQFSAAGRVTGSDGCNRITGAYTLEGERLSFSSMAGTRMACPQLQGRDAAFNSALMRVTAWRIQGGVLELIADGATLLRLHARSQQPAVPAGAPDCAAPVTQADMNRCAEEDFLKATAEYASAYQAVSNTLPAARKASFRTAQTAWIRYRTTACNFEASGAQGGSVQPMIKWQCDARLSRARAAELHALLECTEGDITCVRPRQ